MVLAYQAATATGKGLLSVAAKFVGSAVGEPHQEVILPEAPLQEFSLELYTLEQDSWRSWQERNDFDSSARDDAHFLLDATHGNVTFGDGRQGRVPGPGALIFATYRVTQAQEGNLKADSISELSDSPHNRAVLPNFGAVKNRFAWIKNAIPADAGSAAEDLVHAQGRALALMGTSSRAVTLADYERLAKETPGVQLARVTARANLHPSFPCWKAPGLVTVIVVPSLPSPRAAPSFGLRRAVASYLQPRRIIGTRVEVVGPAYIEIGIRATVQSLERTDTTALQQRIVDALNEFFDPLRGGPEKTGWPFGRDVYRSEVLQVIDEVPGVDYVLALEIAADGCPPHCGNVCIPPTALVVPGSHDIEVAGGEGVSTRTN
jgi:predicted phage baseplate assembly protein